MAISIIIELLYRSRYSFKLLSLNICNYHPNCHVCRSQFTMQIRVSQRSLWYINSIGSCITFAGSCWVLYQIRRISQILQSAVNTNVLQLEQGLTQYIYLDDSRFEDVVFWENKLNLEEFVKESRPSTYSYLKTNWSSFHRNWAYKLLHVAQTGSKSDRWKALCSLSRSSHLNDWDYRHMAQMLNAKTAIILARMPNLEPRFFLKPPYDHVRLKLDDVRKRLCSMLINLNKSCNGCHKCLSEFIDKRLCNYQQESLFQDYDLVITGMTMARSVVWDQNLFQNCIQAIYHHSTFACHVRDIIDAKGLSVLMDVQKLFPADLDISVLLAEVLSNISIHSEYLDDIFRSGWIGVLAVWSHHEDVRLSATAARALANLDAEDDHNEKYPTRIYLLHPLYRDEMSKKLDVIFVHGLLGGVFITWRQRDLDASKRGLMDTFSSSHGSDSALFPGNHPQEFLLDLSRDLRMHEWKQLGHDFEVVLHDCPEASNSEARGPFTCSGNDIYLEHEEKDSSKRTQCWPRDWLGKDVPYLRILGINYDTNLSMWTPLCPTEGSKNTISERSEEFIQKLIMTGVGKRPIVWVCHSMGGLLVKKMLLEEWKNGDKHKLCQNTRSIIFYSTPHRGSHVPTLMTTQMLVWPSLEVQELWEESPALLQLNQEFVRMLKQYSMDIISFCETKSTLVTALRFPIQFVTSHSADPGVGEFYEIPQNHLSICKPANRQSFLYRKVLETIKHHVNLPKE
ncbi:protein SERAC1 [Orussus abietinus]|uniref:protein SERAC1 n=1 Tax=Orussus abietinus TaxID=222816 RepID=UPI000C7161B6|nr:protein SERAC1 [Orussus abietinus]